MLEKLLKTLKIDIIIPNLVFLDMEYAI